MTSAANPASARVGFTRFVVIGQGRSGSTLVSTALANHPRIRMHGEVFNHEPNARREAFSGIYAESGRSNGAEPECYKDGVDGEQFLREVVFAEPNPDEYEAVGFKMIYGQTETDAASRRAWSYLESDPAIKVIHVRRDNLMAGFVSYQTALRTRSWAVFVADDSRRAPEPELVLQPEGCESYFRWVYKSQQRLREAFAHHRFCEVIFERDLVGEFAATSDRLQDFIGVPRVALAPVTKRQSEKPWPRRVVNFEQLRAHFQNTEYGRFFTGEST